MGIKNVLAGLAVTGLLLISLANEATAQISSTVYNSRDKRVAISFVDAIEQPNPPNPRTVLIYFEDSTGKLVQLWGNARAAGDNGIDVVDFRVDENPNAPPFDLETGSRATSDHPAIPGIAPGQARAYTFIVKGLKLNGEPKARPVQTSVELSASSTGTPPQIFVAAMSNKSEPYDLSSIIVRPIGIPPKTLLEKFQNSPGRIKISYRLSPDDPAPNVQTFAASIKPDPKAINRANPVNLVIEPQDKMPLRAKKYSVVLSFPAEDLRGTEEATYQIPPDKTSVEASRVAELLPSTQSERAKTQFYFETTYTSTVDPKTRNRANVGIFGIHWKPTLPLLTRNVYAEKDKEFGDKHKRPVWMAFRPLFEADFDTQSPKVSKSPNRVQFGFDWELGIDAGFSKPPEQGQKVKRSFVQQTVWINGIRFDSDRDFKLQTLYWHTEFAPRFLNFEQTTEMRQYAYDMMTKKLQSQATTPQARALLEQRAKGPFVSAYRIKPSLAYELGGLVKRDTRPIGFPTNAISRLLFGLDLGIEMKRTVSFAIANSYYFLENAERRRNRDYAEARVELNTGYLFNRNFNGFQNAVVFKFQRGDQAPKFGSVNSLSVGFKIFQ